MKICFSTLGCPDWSWQDIVATAKDFGYDGIEVRGIEKEIYVPHARPFQSDEIEKNRRHLSNLNLKIACLTSACYLHRPQEKEKYIQEAKEYIDLASKLECPFIRVLGDSDPQPGAHIDIDAVGDALVILGSYAADKNVKVLIETNGAFAGSQLLKKVMEQVDSQNVGVLWDIHHPYRFMNEPAEVTYSALAPYIQHVHIKDSVMENGRVIYKMMGCGDIPIRDTLALLKRNEFKGFVSLEWVKRWYSDLEEPGIVFMQFENYIRNMWEKL